MADSPQPARAERSDVTVLIIDDDPRACLLLRGILEGEGYRVAVAVDGPQALRELHRACPRIALVGLDFPAEWVEEIAVEVRSVYGSMSAVIVFSVDSDGRIRAYRAADDGYLSKPFDAAALGDRVAEALGA
jgi:DNA-binding response OmpR family regulator